MSGGQRVILAMEVILLAGLIAGVIARRRLRLCASFGLYLAAVFGPDVAILADPARFFTWNLWIARELVQAIFKLAIPVEITLRAFQAFRGVRARAVPLIVVLIAMTVVATAVGASLGAPDAARLAQAMMPALLTGTAWLFGIVLALALWYRVPLHPWHRALLAGFVPYLLLFTIAVKLLESLGWARLALSHAYTVGYLALLGYLCMAAWRRDAPAPASPELVHRLQPWREA